MAEKRKETAFPSDAALHRQHRQRMKERFRETGSRAFQDYQLLEILLFFAIPQGDTNPLAHRLMERFGSLSAVLEADEQELQKVPGIGDHASFLLHFLPEFLKRYQQSRLTHNDRLFFPDRNTVLKYVDSCFLGAQPTESVLLIALNARRELIGSFFSESSLLNGSTATRTSVGFQGIVSKLLSCRAAGCILAHFHPEGLLLPSPEDAMLTELLANFLHQGGFFFYDHIIANESGSVSYQQEQGNPLWPPLSPKTFDPLF